MFGKSKTRSRRLLIIAFMATVGASAAAAIEPNIRIATFSADVTVPLGHRCMGVLPIKAERVVDPLYAHGLVLLSGQEPVVLLALDYCEVRNGAYEDWRQALGVAAGTSPERVLVCSLHQHDAPVTDTGAEALLAEVGLGGELCDIDFHHATVARVAKALADSLETADPVTHLGLGKAKVENIASSRRVVHPNGQVDYSRYSAIGADAFLKAAPEGDIDAWIKTISFWNGEQALVALSAYAVHPMSYYGKGEISADFVGMARDRRQRDDFSIRQIYVSGCSGDVTAGKYNDGSVENRPVLADRLYVGMVEAWKNTEKVPLEHFKFRNTRLDLEFHDGADFTKDALSKTLHDPNVQLRERILAAMGLSSLERVSAGRQIDMPCLDFGPAQIVLFPGESFVAYQLWAQEIRSESLVMAIGYGECWPGYIPTERAFAENFDHGWRWVAPGAEARIQSALRSVLLDN